MLDLIREAPFGQLFRYLFGNQILRYPEEEPEFKLPHSYQKALEAQHKDLQGPSIGSLALGEDSRSNKPRTSDQELGRDSWPKEFQTVDDDHTPKVHTDGSILVDFYTDDDPANTLNWSNSKRALVSAIICLYTWVSPGWSTGLPLIESSAASLSRPHQPYTPTASLVSSQSLVCLIRLSTSGCLSMSWHV